LNKKLLIDRVTEKVDLKKKEVALVMDVIFDEIVMSLKKDGKVNLVGFGSFEVRNRLSREGRSPIDHKKITIPPSKYVGFKAGTTLKKQIRE
jgi:DNA-binding protein HU-beta